MQYNVVSFKHGRYYGNVLCDVSQLGLFRSCFDYTCNSIVHSFVTRDTVYGSRSRAVVVRVCARTAHVRGEAGGCAYRLACYLLCAVRACTD